jgi:hypothetical protein
MATYRTLNALTDIDAAYITGLIGGAGTITLGRKHRTDRRQLVVSISSTERQILEYVLQTTGIGKITTKRTASALHVPSYTCTATNRQALQLLELIHSCLRTYKARRAHLILEKSVALTPRNSRYTARIGEERAQFEEQLLAIKAH